jgi:hypothetical protein
MWTAEFPQSRAGWPLWARNDGLHGVCTLTEYRGFEPWRRDSPARMRKWGEFPRKTRGDLTITSKLRAKSTNLRRPVSGEEAIIRKASCTSGGVTPMESYKEQRESVMERCSTRGHPNMDRERSVLSPVSESRPGAPVFVLCGAALSRTVPREFEASGWPLSLASSDRGSGQVLRSQTAASKLWVQS